MQNMDDLQLKMVATGHRILRKVSCIRRTSMDVTLLSLHLLILNEEELLFERPCAVASVVSEPVSLPYRSVDLTCS